MPSNCRRLIQKGPHVFQLSRHRQSQWGRLVLSCELLPTLKPTLQSSLIPVILSITVSLPRRVEPIIEAIFVLKYLIFSEKKEKKLHLECLGMWTKKHFESQNTSDQKLTKPFPYFSHACSQLAQETEKGQMNLSDSCLGDHYFLGGGGIYWSHHIYKVFICIVKAQSATTHTDVCACVW